MRQGNMALWEYQLNNRGAMQIIYLQSFRNSG